jgi:hypothetical protein
MVLSRDFRMNASSHKSVNERDERDAARELNTWLDDALEQSFPASDPLPSFRGDPIPPALPSEESGDQEPRA